MLKVALGLAGLCLQNCAPRGVRPLDPKDDELPNKLDRLIKRTAESCRYALGLWKFGGAAKSPRGYWSDPRRIRLAFWRTGPLRVNPNRLSPERP